MGQCYSMNIAASVSINQLYDGSSTLSRAAMASPPKESCFTGVSSLKSDLFYRLCIYRFSLIYFLEMSSSLYQAVLVSSFLHF